MEAHRGKGGRVAAVLPVHNPRALLRAHGFLPVEVWGPPGHDLSSGDVHLQAYTCSVVRHALAFISDGKLTGRADCVLVPHACDSLQGLGSVLLDFAKSDLPVLPYYLPRGQRASDRRFLAAELRALAGRLAEITGAKVRDEDLHAACEREEAADEVLAKLLSRRTALEIDNRHFYELARSREYLPAEAFIKQAETVLAAAKKDLEAPDLPVLLSGLMPEPMSILDALDAAGATVVADDLACLGRRLYQPSQAKDPYLRMAEGLLSGAPDSTRGVSIEARAEHLIRLAKDRGARGLIFFLVKFCEPEQFYLPQLQKRFKGVNLRSMMVEVHIGETLPDQVITRLEAFLETLT